MSINVRSYWKVLTGNVTRSTYINSMETQSKYRKGHTEYIQEVETRSTYRKGYMRYRKGKHGVHVGKVTRSTYR